MVVFLEGGKFGALEIGFDLIVLHAGEQHLAGRAGIEWRAHAEIGHAPHRMQAFDEIDVHAKIAERTDRMTVSFTSLRISRMTGIATSCTLLCRRRMSASRTSSKPRLYFPVCGSISQKSALDETAENAKHGCLRKADRLHDFSQDRATAAHG